MTRYLDLAMLAFVVYVALLALWADVERQENNAAWRAAVAREEGRR